jgi:exonuclease VII large subunit
MNDSLSQILKDKRNTLLKVDEIKLKSYLQNRINEERQTTDLLQKDLTNHCRIQLETSKGRLVRSIAKLEGINPLSTILRGYAIVFDKEHKKTISTIEKVKEGDNINIMLINGVVSCIVTKKEKEEHFLEYITKFKASKK